MNYGTAYFGLDTDPAIFELAIRALAEGNSVRSTARIVGVDKDTICAWLDRAGQQCRLVLLHLWQNLHVSECQLDELWSFVHTKEGNLATAQPICDSYGDAWVWVAFAPVWRFVVAFVAGKRTQTSANLLLERVAYVTDDLIPFFTSDQLPEYRNALLHIYGQWWQPTRQGRRGRHPKPRRIPAAGLLYAQVVKRRENGRLVEVVSKVVFGTPEQIADRLAASTVSTTVNTSFVERDNLTFRQQNRRLTRKTSLSPRRCLGWKSNFGCILPTLIWSYPTIVCAKNCLARSLPEEMGLKNAGNRLLPRWPLRLLTISGQPMNCYRIESLLTSWTPCTKLKCFSRIRILPIKVIEGHYRNLRNLRLNSSC